MRFKQMISGRGKVHGKSILLLVLIHLYTYSYSQPFSFAHVTDTHIGGSTGVEDLERTVADINSVPDIDFVLVTGDITEFGSGEELRTAKNILDRLQKPYYVVPGNHDSKWSESGGNDFVQIFGSETFRFEKNGILFIGTSSGPNMRMGPGLVPREQILFIDSVLSHLANAAQPIIFINHYPVDESLFNSQKILDLFENRNILVTLLGHGHANKLFDLQGIPGIMGRSNLRASRKTGGYNIGTVRNDTLFYAERIPGDKTLPVWCKVAFRERSAFQAQIQTQAKAKAEAETMPQTNTMAQAGVREIWSVTEQSDIGAGIAARGRVCVYSTTDGRIIARDPRDGSFLWQFQTGGKVYSTPFIKGNRVICPSTDGNIRALSLHTGILLWEYNTSKPIVSSPVVRKNRVFTGSSEGKFRAISLSTGKLLWQYDSVRNFVETRPLLYKKGVYFGSWGNTFYALDQKTGRLLWKREKYNNRMLSPAAVWPVAARGKVFTVAPDRHFTAIDAHTGKEIWDSGKYSCRESIGISRNGKLVYIKNMTEGNVDAFSTRSDTLQLAWECKAGLGYEIAPSPITESTRLIFIPTATGLMYAINQKKHEVEWTRKISDALVNHILPLSGHRLLVTTFDGKAVCLKY